MKSLLGARRRRVETIAWILLVLASMVLAGIDGLVVVAVHVSTRERSAMEEVCALLAPRGAVTRSVHGHGCCFFQSAGRSGCPGSRAPIGWSLGVAGGERSPQDGLVPEGAGCG